MSTKAFLKGIETWKKETVVKKEAARSLESKVEVVVSKPASKSLGNVNIENETKGPKKEKVPVIENVYWKGVLLLFAVWFIILGLQIGKVPVAGALTMYEAARLYKGKRKISSKGEGTISKLRVAKLILHCGCGVVAGIVGGLLGLGGGFILGPLFLEMGIPPQVSSATSTFAVTTIAGIAGQYVVKKVVDLLGRASIIIFILSLTILISAIALGGVGIADMIKDIEHKDYMGFENMCS